MARIGTEKHPAVLRVRNNDRALEVVQICNENGVHFILGLEPDKPEDISDLERALNPPEPMLASPRVGRNDPCPCGSGKKFKQCCGSPEKLN